MKPCVILYLWINDIHEYNLPNPQSAFTHNPGSTFIYGAVASVKAKGKVWRFLPQQRMEEEKQKEMEREHLDIQIEREKRKLEEERRMREAQIENEKMKIEAERKIHLLRVDEQGPIL